LRLNLLKSARPERPAPRRIKVPGSGIEAGPAGSGSVIGGSGSIIGGV